MLLAAGAACLPGCGGDDRGSAPRSPAVTTTQAGTATAAPKANEPLAAAAQRLSRAVAKGDCQPLAGLLLHSVPRGPDAAPTTPATPQECSSIAIGVQSKLRGFKLTRAQEFGPAGVVEGTGASARPGQVVVIAWVLDTDGSWKAVFTAAYRPQIGHKPRLRDFAGNAQRFVRAAATRDCDGFWRLLNAGSRFVRSVNGKKAAFCKNIVVSYRDKRSGIADLAANPDAKPEELGTVGDLGFYGVRLKSGRYLALVLSGRIQGPIDAEQKDHGNPTVAELVTVRRPAG